VKRNYTILSLVLLFATVQAYAQSGGNGSPGNPYQIKNCDDLQAMEKYPTDYWVLMNNIDCSATQNGTGQWSSTGFRPVGDSLVRFSGNFNGNCFSIDNLYINRPAQNYVGLFGFTDSSAYIDHVEILSASVTGKDHTGICIGYKRSTYLDDCFTTGNVNGHNYTGGVVGLSDNYQGTEAEITNSSSQATVNGTNFTGGVVGKITTFQGGASYLTNCYSTGTITGNNSVGGVAGNCGTFQGGGAELQYCFATGTVTGNDSVGGLVGSMGPYQGGGSDIIQSYATGNVSGKNAVGGLAGFNGPNSGGGSEIYDSYAQGSVSGTKNVGGLVGSEVALGVGNSIDTSYSSGKVTGSINVGGFVGTLSGSPLSTDYWDSAVNLTLKSTGNLGNIAGVMPSSTVQMQTQATYISWNFTSIWAITVSNFPTLYPAPSGGTCSFPTKLAADFVFNIDTCLGDTVYFTDKSIGSPSAWAWNFGDPSSGPNNTSALQNPKHLFSGAGTYTVKLIASKGVLKDSITASSLVVSCIVLGTNNFTLKPALTVYPNPGNGLFTFGLQNITDRAHLELYNMLGEQIYSSTINIGNTVVNLCNEPSGVYFYRVTSANGTPISNNKLIIE
jgi:PKD repeat protein